jgi:hypothetical protein
LAAHRLDITLQGPCASVNFIQLKIALSQAQSKTSA